MDTVLLWVVRLVAVATLLPAFFATWGLAGADGTPRNVVAPFLGLAVLASSAWAVVTAFGTLPDTVSRALAIFALAPAAYLVAWPFSGNESTGREPLLGYLRDAIWLSGPLLSGALYAAAA